MDENTADDGTSTNGETQRSRWWVPALGITIVLAIGAAIAGALYWVVGASIAALATIDTNVAVCLAFASPIAIVATLAILISQYTNRCCQREIRLLERKYEAYDEFLKAISDILLGSPGKSKSRGNEPNRDLVALLRDSKRRFLLLTDPSVMRACSIWFRALQESPDSLETLLKLDAFIVEMRADLGQRTPNVECGDVAELLLRDIDFFLEEARDNLRITAAVRPEPQRAKR